MADVKGIVERLDPQLKYLIPILQAVQEEDGCVSPQAVDEIALELNISPGRVYGVASFYDQFTFSKAGSHIIAVCDGTSCYAEGAMAIIGALERELGILCGDDTQDGKFSLRTGTCPGCCALAPLITIDGVVHGKMTPEKAVELVRSCDDDGGAES
jgi:NADH:ubiquinone oxidoreductase subunit E